MQAVVLRVVQKRLTDLGCTQAVSHVVNLLNLMQTCNSSQTILMQPMSILEHGGSLWCCTNRLNVFGSNPDMVGSLQQLNAMSVLFKHVWSVVNSWI